MIMFRSKEGPKKKGFSFKQSYHFFLNSLFVIKKRFKAINDDVVTITNYFQNI